MVQRVLCVIMADNVRSSEPDRLLLESRREISDKEKFELQGSVLAVLAFCNGLQRKTHNEGGGLILRLSFETVEYRSIYGAQSFSVAFASLVISGVNLTI